MNVILHKGAKVDYAPEHESIEQAIDWVRKNIKPEAWNEYEVHSPSGFRISIRKSYGY